MSKYVGITIGPIYDTLKLSSKPAGLWAASYLFSYMGKELCRSIREKYSEDEVQILIPNVSFDEKGNVKKYSEYMKKGVGLFHDRIIFSVNINKSKEKVIEEIEEHIVSPVRDEILTNILQDLKCNGIKISDIEEQLKKCFQIYVYTACIEIKENEAIIPAISGALDVLEVQRYISAKTEREYLYEFLNNNEVIKNCFLKKNIENRKWQLWVGEENGKLKSIEDLCGNSKYYALVQADGDGMGKVLCGLTNEDEIKDFSKKCLEYAAKASEIIESYDGITIYAGGDDLLFLAPINAVAEKSKDILSLIMELRIAFKNEFPETEESIYKACNVSYGVQIVYYKYPLYEAFDMVGYQLFVKGKEMRNSCAMSIQKHSGQSHSFVIHNFSKNKITEQIRNLIMHKEKTDSGKQRQEFLHSVWKHMQEKAEIFKKAKKEGCIETVFSNVFDNETQIKYKEDITLIQQIYKEMEEKEITGSQTDMPILDILRFADFYCVKENNENERE